MAADAPEGGNAYQQVVAVSAREGAPLDAAALWAGEVDLTQLAWTDSQTGRPVSAAELLIWGLRENMEAYAIGIQAATEATVIFYAAVDDAWVEMGSTTTSQKASWGSRLSAAGVLTSAARMWYDGGTGGMEVQLKNETEKRRIRPYQPDDCLRLAALFYDTVHTVNARDDSPAQLDAWAAGQADLERWNESFSAHHTLVAEQDGQIVGFGDMDDGGYLDRLYVHRDYQRQGIAAALCDALEQACRQERLETHASITARPFFKQRGYRVVRQQQVERGGVRLTNFVMEKVRPCPGAAQQAGAALRQWEKEETDR